MSGGASSPKTGFVVTCNAACDPAYAIPPPPPRARMYCTPFFPPNRPRIPIPGFKEFGVGDHESQPTPALVKALGCKQGVVTTGSSFDHTEMDDAMMDENGEKIIVLCRVYVFSTLEYSKN